MHNSVKVWLKSSHLYIANYGWIEYLYKDFLINPNLVNRSWRSTFREISNGTVQYNPNYNNSSRYLKTNNIQCYVPINCNYNAFNDINNIKQLKIMQLIEAYRFYGHQQAKIDPLGLRKLNRIENLKPSYYGLGKLDFQTEFSISSFIFNKKSKSNRIKLHKLIKILKQTYCSSIGIEYMHISSAKEKYWIQQRIESVAGRPHFSSEEKKRFLSALIAAEGLERYLNTKFPGIKRFSLEGGDALILMLKEMFNHLGNTNISKVVLGMTHRGRLNVLINVLGKSLQDLFKEFTNQQKEHFINGDVNYHMGFSSDIETKNGTLLHLSLLFNPSHLEIINPVVMGSVRARLDRLNCINKLDNSNKVLPITIHGDAAVIGQGVFQETLNMSQTRGYEVGGSIRIIINNQIGFTTSNLLDYHSAYYCSDIGKMIQTPIFHVNADDPESVVFVTHLALDFRNTFKRDVFIDLVCYRRHGHNEFDEPSATQPMMYQKIKKHPTSCKIYSNKLQAEKVVTLKDINNMINNYRNILDNGGCVVKEWRPPANKDSSVWAPYIKSKWNESYQNKVDIKHLQELAKRISSIPKAIKMQSHVAKIYNDRQSMAIGDKKFDWSSAENLAYATLVDVGISVRLSGEDSSRGTFFHRHAIIHNQIDGSTYIPLQHIKNSQGEFRVWDSILSEEAVLAFEYGYASTEPNALTIWEAQFGDFANCAQVVIDQFISSGEQKWGRMCGLVMLLPHGYEGQGPDHSSARLERYLQLCAERNIQVCIPSTPAQIYHVLRRQVLRNIRIPLVVMSPKSLLRHPLAVSGFDELANGNFLPAIGEIDKIYFKYVKRIIMCSGKIYYDLIEQRRKNNQKNIVIMRIEQLYPFPYQTVRRLIKQYDHVHDFVWCQEEPINQGAWYYYQRNFSKIIPSSSTLSYLGRPTSASTAVGYMSIHYKQQQDLINNALNIN